MVRVPINFQQKFGLFTEQWQPKVIAEMNDYQFKVVNCRVISFGTITNTPMRHSSSWKGRCGLTSATVASHISAGEMFVVPKGIEHKPYAEREVKLLLIEPRGVLNTGHEGGGRTAVNDIWI